MTGKITTSVAEGGFNPEITIAMDLLIPSTKNSNYYQSYIQIANWDNNSVTGTTSYLNLNCYWGP